MSRPSPALLALAALFASGCTTSTTERLKLPPLRTAPAVDLQRYLGTWYEIASFPSASRRAAPPRPPSTRSVTTATSTS